LREAAGVEQQQLAQVLMQRNRRGSWVTLIRAFHKLDENMQQQVLARPRDLFGPLAETMQDFTGAARENVIAIVQRCTDVRLVYLLAEALMDPRPEVRTLAGNSLLEAVRRHWQAVHTPLEEGAQVDAESDALLHRAIDTALRHFKTHRQNATVLAALIHERQQDSDLWLLFQDAYDDRMRAATVLLRAPAEPALAAATLLALGSSLKPAAVAGLSTAETPVMAAAFAAESYRLIDPVLREPAQAVSHLKMFPALRKEPPWTLETWPAWLRLMELVGLQPAERLIWLTQLLETAPPRPEACPWKIAAARALADTLLPEAVKPLAGLAQDPDERVARCAGRFLLQNGGPAGWRQRAQHALLASPHASVRRLWAQHRALAREPDPAALARRPAVRSGFDRVWNGFQRMPPAVRRTAARTVAMDPALADQLRVKFQGDVLEVAQALKMIMALPDLSAYRNQIISLCGHGDPRIASLAVRLVGRLEDPRLRDLLEAAAQHPDGRVRANAVEAMEELNIAHHSQQVLAMLDSRHNRERANAIRALGKFDFATARDCLQRMLTDASPLHRMSALWVVGQLNLLEIMRQVSNMARRDPNTRIRRRAAEMLETLSGSLAQHL
jgi:HEAT repeat protein